MNREKSNPNPSHTFPEPLDFSTLKKSREWRGGVGGAGRGVRLRGRPNARHGAFDCFQRGLDIFTRRPGFHSFASGRTNP